MSRLSLIVEVMVPNCGVLNVRSGIWNCGWLRMLNASNRNCSLRWDSALRGKSLNTEKSKFVWLGPVATFRLVAPKANPSGRRKAAALMNRCTLRWSDGRFGEIPVASGRIFDDPVLDWSKGDETVNARPL